MKLVNLYEFHFTHSGHPDSFVMYVNKDKITSITLSRRQADEPDDTEWVCNIVIYLDDGTYLYTQDDEYFHVTFDKSEELLKALGYKEE